MTPYHVYTNPRAMTLASSRSARPQTRPADAAPPSPGLSRYELAKLVAEMLG